MKKLIYTLSLAVMAVSCSGNIDPEDTGGTSSAYTAPYTISVDRTEVEASGNDWVTFSLKDSQGREMMSDKNALQSINIISDRGVRVNRMETSARFIANGEYTFTARYKGVTSENNVVVTARNRAKYEVYHKKVGLFKCTSVWCSACPYLSQTLHALPESVKDHTVLLSCHGNFQQNDPFSLYVGQTDLGSYLIGRYGGSGWPTLIYNLDKAVTGAASSADIEQAVMEYRIAYPATCGIKVTEVCVDGADLKVKASMKSSKGGDYDMACAVLRNGVQFTGTGSFSVDNSGIYDEVVFAMSESALGYHEGEKVAADCEISEEFSFSLGSTELSETDLRDFYVAVYVHRWVDGISVLDNIVTCQYGDTVDYHLND